MTLTSQTPLSPPLPPTHFNPVPDVHPLLLAATTRTPSNESAAGLQITHNADAEGDMNMVLSPLMSPSAGGSAFAFALGPSMTNNNLALLKSPTSVSTPPRRYSGGSNVSATTPNTTASQQSSPFHFAEFQTEIGTLQRRLSEERSRRSSVHSAKRSDRAANARLQEIEAGDATDEVPNETVTTAKESSSGTTSERPTMKTSASSGTASSAESEAIAVEHLREARQELQAVLEEALEESCTKMETLGNTAYINLEIDQNGEPEILAREDHYPQSVRISDTDHLDQSHLTEGSDKLDTRAPSPMMSPLLTSSIPDPQGGGPISFEDLVRHQRRNSDSASNNTPLFSPGARSSPTSPVPQPMRSRTGSTSGSIKDGPRSRSRHTSISRSPIAANTGNQSTTPGISQLTKMRRKFSAAEDNDDQSSDTQHSELMLVNGAAEKNGAGERVYSPASILLAAEAANVASREQSRMSSPTVDNGTGLKETSAAVRIREPDMPVAGANERETRTHSNQLLGSQSQVRPIDDGVSRVYQWRNASQSDTQEQPPAGQSDSELSAHHDTHLWDSVWPSSTASTSNAITSGHVPFPKPITDASPGLRPRLPMHSRTMSTNFGSGLVSNNTLPTHVDVDRLPMMHSLSFPRAASSHHDRPVPLSTLPSYNSGVPLFFSSALQQGAAPSAWPQGSSARRGSLASLGSWPLNKNASVDPPGNAPREETAGKPRTANSTDGDIPEEDEVESDSHVRSVQ